MVCLFIFINADSVFSQTTPHTANPATISAPFTNGFFIPQKELTPRYEKLPPIALPAATPSAADRIKPKTPNVQPVQKRVSKYIAVDGRFIPIYEKQEASSPPEDENDVNLITQENNTEAVITTDFIDEESEDPIPNSFHSDNTDIVTQNISPLNKHDEIEDNQTAVERSPSPTQNEPQDDSGQSLPRYRYRYAQYLQDLQIFQQSGRFPYNDDLEKTLGKMTSNQSITLYQNTPH